MPVQIDARALQSLLEELASSTNMPPTILCRFEYSFPVIVADNSAATHLYRIAQEAVSNALRHSQASETVLSLRQNGEEMRSAVLIAKRTIKPGGLFGPDLFAMRSDKRGGPKQYHKWPCRWEWL